MLNDLLVVNFETGDADCRYYPVVVLVDATACDSRFLEGVKTKLMAALAFDLAYEEMLEAVLDECSIDWMTFYTGARIEHVHVIDVE